MGGTFALAFIAQHDLSNLLTGEVRAAARRAYRPGAASIKLGRLPAKPSVIEAIADELGVFFRNLFYQSKPTPIDSKGVRSSNAALTLMADEWIHQDPRLVGSKLRFLRCDAIDFDNLKVQLDRETRGILPPSADVAEGRLDELISLTPADRNILEALAKAPATMIQVVIVEESGEPLRIVKDRLLKLEQTFLVVRPHGPRRGYAITKEGRNVLAS